ncbi:MAG: hypothetical protein JOZ84_11995 [Methylobacteriaceae bacterium]|nr:hypothetical protein [Methylobacteriaceae bacterium]
MLNRPLILVFVLALGGLAPAAAEEQSWSQRTPPPAKFAAPPAKEKPHDWSGIYVGVQGGPAFTRGHRESVAPGASVLPE